MLVGMDNERYVGVMLSGWEQDDNLRVMGKDKRILSQGGKMFRFVFYKEYYSCRLQNGLERRVDVREISYKIVEVIQVIYYIEVMEGGEKWVE